MGAGPNKDAIIDSVVGCTQASCITSGGVVAKAKQPTVEQKAAVQRLAQDLVVKHEGASAAPAVARAYKRTFVRGGYSGAAGYASPSAWTHARELFAACCRGQERPEGDAMMGQPGVGDEVVDVNITVCHVAKSSDPGAPKDAMPPAFLGPMPGDQRPARAAGDRGLYGMSSQDSPPGTGVQPYPWANGSAASNHDAAANGAPPGGGVEAKEVAAQPYGEMRVAKKENGYNLGSFGTAAVIAGRGYAAQGYGTIPAAQPVLPPAEASGGGLDKYKVREGPHPSVASPHREGQAASAEDQAKDALASAAKRRTDFKQRYTLGKRLNAGAQGTTYLATANFSGLQVVVKKPNKSDDVRDYHLLSTKTHPNIVRVYELWQDQTETYVIMEHCAGGDLWHAIEKLGSPTQNWAACTFRQVLWGVYYLHDFFNESHNDLKPENIFLDRVPAGISDVPRVMIGDFGCLAAVGKAEDGGDPRYRAPELFAKQTWGKSTDMWALGVTLYEIATGGLMIHIDEPNMSSWGKFRSSDKWDPLLRELTRGTPVKLDKLDSEGSGLETSQLKALVAGLLDTKPSRRLTAKVALDQPWLLLDTKEKPITFSVNASKSIVQRAKRHVLDMALLNLVGGMLQGESIQYYERIWRRYDTDYNGRMQWSEFEKMVTDLRAGTVDAGLKEGAGAAGGDKEASPAGAAATASAGASQAAGGGADNTESLGAQELFTLADTDRSGAVEFGEFVGVMFSPDQLSSSELSEYLKQAFESLAGDDARISAQELAGLFVNLSWTEAREGSELCAALFKAMDTDEDGYISFPEFSAYMDNL